VARRAKGGSAGFFGIPATYWIVGICVLVFIIQMIGLGAKVPVTESLWLNPGEIVQGKELWGLFTNMFVHADFLHLFINMWVLFMFGIVLERLIGSKDFLISFLVCGVFASIFYVITSLFILGSDIPAVGASGAVMGIIGMIMVLKPHEKVIMIFPPIPKPIDLWIVGVFFIALSLVLFGFGNWGGIAHNAHLGGILMGLILGYYFKKKIKKSPNYSWDAVYGSGKTHKAIIPEAQPKDPYAWIDEYK